VGDGAGVRGPSVSRASRCVAAALAVATVALSSCASDNKGANPLGSSGRRTTTTYSGPDKGVMKSLPISVEPSSSGVPDSSILLPKVCLLFRDEVTASGAFGGGSAPEAYARVGAVVELYVFSTATADNPQGTQLASLNGGEEPYPMYRATPGWKVSTSVDYSLGTPARCEVSVQPTHDFEGAGNNGG